MSVSLIVHGTTNIIHTNKLDNPSTPNKPYPQLRVTTRKINGGNKKKEKLKKCKNASPYTGGQAGTGSPRVFEPLPESTSLACTRGYHKGRFVCWYVIRGEMKDRCT